MPRYSSKLLDSSCPRCRGPITFDPSTGKNTCEACGWPGTKVNWEMLLGWVLIFAAVAIFNGGFFYFTVGPKSLIPALLGAFGAWFGVLHGGYVMWTGEVYIRYQRGFLWFTPDRHFRLQGWPARIYGLFLFVGGALGVVVLYYAALTNFFKS